MEDRRVRCSRRKFLARAAGLTLASGISTAASPDSPQSASNFRARPPRPDKAGRKPIAVITTVYRPLSHADHIAGRFIQGYPRDGHFHVPAHYVASMYVDQSPDNDLSRELSRDFDFRLARSVTEALTQGGSKLAVDAVLLIGEHGNYPRNDKDQILYPRFEMMEQVVKAFNKTGRSVPVFNDKHLSYSWAKAKQMVQWSEDLRFPLMAGSSLPVTWRRPELELPLGAAIQEGLVAAFGGVEVYGFHALESLQVMLERRQTGESGVRAVTCLTGSEVWRAGDAGQWSWDLLEAALGRSETVCPGDVRRNVGGTAVGNQPRTPATAFLVEYRDGIRGTVLLLNGHIQDFCFAARIRGEPKPASCMFYLPSPPGAKYFDCLVSNIEKLLDTGKPPYPIQRTLLTTGVLAAAMESHYLRGSRVETPHLDVPYTAPADSGFCRGIVAAPI
ncbi:MAG: hypothetical protein C5B58_02355 [Acidobacteria bacterium]|nr:MAG: hypothetical protein C5B58_02355 [Acidobacteriota bacterium]